MKGNSSDGKNQYIFIVGSLRRQFLFIFLIATNVEILTPIIGTEPLVSSAVQRCLPCITCCPFYPIVNSFIFNPQQNGTIQNLP
jgi:hypothetical protein